MTDRELLDLLDNHESDTVELTASTRDTDKFGEAICAFANDLPNHRRPGVLFIGINDDASCAHVAITDQVLKNLAAIRSDGNLLPQPVLIVEKRNLKGCEVAVIIVEPATDTPVRYKGTIWIRTGPRRGRASKQEEQILTEKRRFHDQPFDLRPVSWATLADLNRELFHSTYLPSSVSSDVLEENDRAYEEKLASLRFCSPGVDSKPTITGLLTIGLDPLRFVPGAYIQFLRIDGLELTDPIQDQKLMAGPIPTLIDQLDEVLKAHNAVSGDLTSGNTEIKRPEYPIVALQQITRNAIMHRVYEGTNAPIRITWFRNRVEINSPGGPYGFVTVENFGQPGITDYRNRHLAEAMSNLGYVQRFGIGIALAKREMEKNGNPTPTFQVNQNYVQAVLWASNPT